MLHMNSPLKSDSRGEFKTFSCDEKKPDFTEAGKLAVQMVKTDLRCSLVPLTGFVAFAVGELLSCGMGLVASCQTGARSWGVSHCRHLGYFS